MPSRKMTVVLPLVVLLCGGLIGWYLIASKPSAQRAQPMPASPTVVTTKAEKRTTRLVIKALGTVKPARETVIRSRVSGTVVEIAPHVEPGGLVQEHDRLLRIDPADYENEVRRKKSELARAQAEYELEQGQQKVARAELEQLQKTVPGLVKQSRQDSALALRAPHLAQAKAALAAAETDLAQARLNLARTTLVAPYNALVTDRAVSKGSQAATSDALLTLAGTDSYWVEAAIPLDRLHSLGISRYEGIPVRVLSSTGQAYEGTLLRAVGTLDSVTRMGRVLIEVPDPLGIKLDTPRPPLLLGDQVGVELEAGKLDEVTVLPRAALRNGTNVWVVAGEKLDIRPVRVVWKDADKVYLSEGLEPGTHVVVSDLAAPVQGMPVRLAETPRVDGANGDAANVDSTNGDTGERP